MTSAADRRAWALLTRHASPGDATTLGIVERAGPQEAARQVAVGREGAWEEADAFLAAGAV